MYENDKVRELCGIYDDIVQSVKGELAKGIETDDSAWQRQTLERDRFIFRIA